MQYEGLFPVGPLRPETLYQFTSRCRNSDYGADNVERVFSFTALSGPNHHSLEQFLAASGKSTTGSVKRILGMHGSLRTTMGD